MASSNHTTFIQLDLFPTRDAEEWRAVVGYEGYYEVSNLGRVRSLDREQAQKNRGVLVLYTLKGRILRPAMGHGRGHAYLKVSLTRNNRKKEGMIHRLVLEAFVGPPPEGYVANHKNGIRDDNRPANLEWVTTQRNTQHAIETGLRDFRGEKHPFARLTAADVYTIRRLGKQGMRARDIARQYGMSRECINMILWRKTWKHLPEE